MQRIHYLIRENGDYGLVIVIKTDAEVIGLIQVHGNDAILEFGTEILNGGNHHVATEVLLYSDINAHARAVKGKHGEAAVEVASYRASVKNELHGVVIYSQLA